MKLVTVAGPPSSGKTSILIKTMEILMKKEIKTSVFKFDCLKTDDDILYQNRGIEAKKGLSGGLCPDHYFVSNIDDCVQWGIQNAVEILITESAGLCNRCSPHIQEILSVCVIDNLMGVYSPRKLGPMLQFADIVLITKGDIVSQAEREIFAYRVRAENARAKIINVNGITGQGAYEVSQIFVEESNNIDSLEEYRLRFTMPEALCSYCLGEIKIGKDYQVGNVKKIEMD